MREIEKELDGRAAVPHWCRVRLSIGCLSVRSTATEWIPVALLRQERLSQSPRSNSGTIQALACRQLPSPRYCARIFWEVEGGVQSTLFYIFNHCYFISSPSKLKSCHKIKQPYIHNTMPKHENNAFQKTFQNQLKMVYFSVESAPCLGHMHCMHCIIFTWYPIQNRHLLTASPLFSHLITHYHCMAKHICLITKH